MFSPKNDMQEPSLEQNPEDSATSVSQRLFVKVGDESSQLYRKDGSCMSCLVLWGWRHVTKILIKMCPLSTDGAILIWNMLKLINIGLLFSPTAPQMDCNAQQKFACDFRGGCIEWELTCDGNRTCPNGEDEDPNFCRKWAWPGESGAGGGGRMYSMGADMWPGESGAGGGGRMYRVGADMWWEQDVPEWRGWGPKLLP